MGTTVSLTDAHLTVEPGSSVSTQLRVRNTGEVVDQFAFQPLGDAAAWITVEPAVVRLFPDSDETVTLTIAPPRDPSATPGANDWAIKAIPQEDPDGAAVAEGVVDVGTFVDYAAELQPVTGRGRLTGRFDLAIDNRGNMPLPVRLSGTDKESFLGYDFSPTLVETTPGSAHFAKLKIKPEKRMWRGQPKTHPFELLVEPQVTATSEQTDATVDPGTADGAVAVAAPPIAEPTTVAGVLLQEPVIPKWLWKALLIAFAALVALWVLWKTVFQPSIESAAREIAVEEVAEVEEQVAEVEEQVEAAAADVAAVEEEVAAVEEDVAAVEEDVADGAGGGGGALDNVFNETTEPANMRVSLAAGPGASASDSAADVAADASFALTDIVLQNPRGSLGFVTISIGGQPILETALGSFRNLDYHYVAPYIVDADRPLSVSMECTGVTPPATGCDVAASFSGFETVTTPADG